MVRQKIFGISATDRGHVVSILSEHEPSTSRASSWGALSDVDSHVTLSLSEIVAHSNIGFVCICAERELDHLEARWKQYLEPHPRAWSPRCQLPAARN